MGCDPDDWLAYTTQREGRIRHRWVGAVYYLTLAAILCYVFGYEIIANQGYAHFQKLSGTVHYNEKEVASIHTPTRALPLATTRVAAANASNT